MQLITAKELRQVRRGDAVALRRIAFLLASRSRILVFRIIDNTFTYIKIILPHIMKIVRVI